MPAVVERVMERVMQGGALRRWLRVALKGDALAPVVKRQSGRATRATERHMAVQAVDPVPVPAPATADWAWRPGPWCARLPVREMAGIGPRTEVDPQVTAFHDCPRGEVTLRQFHSDGAEDTAPFGLRLEVSRFAGSFLSLAIALPPPALQGLRLRHIIRLAARLEAEAPLQVFARLNIRHGPNVDQIVRALPMGPDAAVVEFGLAYSGINEARVEDIWLDLIFEAPQMNQITLRDVTLCRRPRAEF